MDHNDLNLEFLIQETFQLSREFQQGSFEDLISLEEEEKEEIEIEVEEEKFPETKGIIYKIDRSIGTFCIRGFLATNIRESFCKLQDNDEVTRKVLRLCPNEEILSVHYFEIPTMELGQIIQEQVLNRRFPLDEDSVCNISDPGFSWWMDLSENRFEIFFRSHGLNRAEKFIQLGPIGDGQTAHVRLNQASRLIRSSFPISEFYCDDRSFAVATQRPEHPGFVAFKKIFLEGINQTTLENFPENHHGRTLYYYFHELAFVRKFWIEVKSKLS